jgi:DNA-binding MarR family transcriptional regulator
MNNLAKTMNASAKLSSVLSLFIAGAMRHDIDTLLRFVKRAELTLPLLAALCVVERRGAVSIGELGACLDCSLANASLLVDKLVCNGCVTRVENANDRRHKLVQLTPKGQALVAELHAARADEVAQQLLQLPPDVLNRTLELLRNVTAELQLSGAQPTTDVAVTAAK